MRLDVSWPNNIADAVTAVELALASETIPLFIDPRAGTTFHRTLMQAVSDIESLDGIAWACTTSGTSGALRIVGRSRESWSASFPPLDDLLCLGRRSRILVTTPPHSSMTVFSIAHALDSGHRVVDRGEADIMHGAPHHLRTLLESGAPLPPVALIGGAALDRTLREQAEDRGVRVISYYGATELSLVAVDSGEGLRPFNNVALEVRDHTLWVRSPYCAERYLVGSGPYRTDGSWASVGDRARIDADVLHVLGRSDDALLSAAATIVPSELEAQLCSLSGVRDAAVVGVPHPRLGTLVGAVIEPHRGVELDARTVREQLRDSVSPSHMPRVWRFTTVPRSTNGKLQRDAAIALCREEPTDG